MLKELYRMTMAKTKREAVLMEIKARKSDGRIKEIFRETTHDDGSVLRETLVTGFDIGQETVAQKIAEYGEAA